MLKLSHISKTFNPGTVNEKVAIRDLSLYLEKGDFCLNLIIPNNFSFYETIRQKLLWGIDKRN